MAQAVPTLTCVAAHFGGYQQWEQSRRDLTDCPNVFFDTSSALFKLSCAQAEDMIGGMGEDRFMFGTDFPMWDHVQEYNRFMRLKLSARTREKIFYRNFERIYHAKV